MKEKKRKIIIMYIVITRDLFGSMKIEFDSFIKAIEFRKKNGGYIKIAVKSENYPNMQYPASGYYRTIQF